MVRVAPIKLQYNPRTLWFNPQDLDIHAGDPVVVKTARGTEFGHADDIIEVEEADIKKLKTELKPVLRIATPDDEAKAAEMELKSKEALPIFKEMAAQASEDMHPVSVEYLLDGDKAVFYFEAEERVDFRDLVRKLASHFHVRVDMRQIGVRDEARMVGGLGHCGQELCCKRLGGEFCPVSIRMAKEQDLSLNPQKISGVCGRLMCCLRYEFDAYKEFKARAPKQNAMIQTPVGPAKVVELDMPKELVSLRTPEGKTVKIPLAEMDTSEGAARPDSVSADVFDAYANKTVLDALGESPLITPHFTGSDKLGDAKARKSSGSKSRSGSSGKRKGSEQPATESRKPRRRRSTTVGAEKGATAGEPQKQGQSSGQKKRSGQRKKGQGQAQGQGGQSQNQNKGSNQQSKKQGQRSGGKAGQKQGQGPRPGQKSSGLRGVESSQKKPASRPQGQGQKPSSQQGSGEGAHRKTRRRSHKAGSGEGAAGSGAADE
ncbi:PSP1 domain-containing protein [Raoultibacter phocaeensis]|uniref:PSP1 domain-containing protein n=1 Tax=Raoultibacter phocaeensis TaxID=2479841 RepID=UPI0011198CCC|nr:regulatory iron-sulfur-containing complex subunit RicT [Raoultibacter phocaeensis]